MVDSPAANVRSIGGKHAQVKCGSGVGGSVDCPAAEVRVVAREVTVDERGVAVGIAVEAAAVTRSRTVCDRAGLEYRRAVGIDEYTAAASAR